MQFLELSGFGLGQNYASQGATQSWILKTTETQNQVDE